MASAKTKRDDDTTATAAWSILSSLKRPFSDRDAIWPVRRRVRLRQEDPPIPEAYTGTALRHKSAELDWAVRQIVSLLGENREQYIVYAPDETQAMQRLADGTQKVVSALMQMLDDRHPIERPRQLCHDFQVADGIAAEKFTFPQEYLETVRKGKGDKSWREAFTEHVRTEKELPLRKHAVDPFTLYWEFDINGLAAVAEHAKARKSALLEEYSESKNVCDAIARIPVGDGFTPGAGTSGSSTTVSVGSPGATTFQDQGDTVNILEVWTRKEFFLMAEGDGGEKSVLMRQKHPFKRPPYFFAPGILTGSQNPLHQFQPLVLPMYPLALELSAVRSARLNAAFLSSFKPFYVKYAAGATEDEEAANIKIHFLLPGSNIPSLKGGEIVAIEWTNLDELEKIEQSLMGDRERFGFQSILAGNVQASGESTAWATRMMRDQGMVQFNGVLRNYAQMRADEVRFIMAFVRDVLKMDLPVARYIEPGGRGKKTGRIEMMYLTQEMCKAGFEVQCRLTAGKASDRISIVEEFRRAHEAGEVSQRMVREEGWQFENASEIEDEVLDEQIRQALLPKLLEQITMLAVQGAEEQLAEPQNMSPDDAAAQAQQQAMMQEQQAQAQAQAMAAGGTTPLPQGADNPVTGEMPAGAAEAGLQQGLVPPEIPADQPQQIVH